MSQRSCAQEKFSHGETVAYVPGVGDFELRPDGGRLAGINLNLASILPVSCRVPSGVLLLDVAIGPGEVNIALESS